MFLLNWPKKIYLLLFILVALGFGISRFHGSQVIHHSDGSTTAVFISLLPLKTSLVQDGLSVTSPDPRQMLEVKLSSVRFFKIEINIREQKLPKGNPVMIRLEKIPTIIPGVTKIFTRTLIPQVIPEVLTVPPDLSGTKAALTLSFNTPLLQKENMGQWITTDFRANLAPQKIRVPSGIYTDYSSWIITPLRPLKHNSTYRITLQPGLTSLSGQALTKPQVFQFATVPELTIVSKSPNPGSSGVPLAARIKVEANREFLSAQVTMADYSGEITVHKNALSFTPNRLLRPDTQYQAIVTVSDQYGETATAAWNYQTIKMGERVWIEANLRLPQTVTVYRGKQILRVMRASGGKSRTPTPRGTFRVYGRGYAFYSYKFREGAYYWLRFNGPFLLHSVPFGADYRLKTEEIAKLGQPASHGCIRLSLEDAKWLYQHIPNQTPVIIHGSPESQAIRTNTDQFENTVFFKDQATFKSFSNRPTAN